MKTTFNACFTGVAMTVLSGCATTDLPELPYDPSINGGYQVTPIDQLEELPPMVATQPLVVEPTVKAEVIIDATSDRLVIPEVLPEIEAVITQESISDTAVESGKIPYSDAVTQIDVVLTALNCKDSSITPNEGVVTTDIKEAFQRFVDANPNVEFSENASSEQVAEVLASERWNNCFTIK
jgi:hypothetical protein